MENTMPIEEKMRLLISDINFLIATRGLPKDPAWKNYCVGQRARDIVEEMHSTDKTKD